MNLVKDGPFSFDNTKATLKESIRIASKACLF